MMADSYDSERLRGGACGIIADGLIGRDLADRHYSERLRGFCDRLMDGQTDRHLQF